MRWEDEPFVKLYTRPSPEFLALSWRARGVFDELMKAVDRAGVLKCGKLGLKAIAVAIRAPWSEIEENVRELVEDGCLVFDEARGVVLMPNFMDAQSASQSDAARKRKSRETARALFDDTKNVTKRDGIVTGQPDSAHAGPSGNVDESVVVGPHQQPMVTKRDHIRSQSVPLESLPVTPGHDESRSVTLEENRSEEIRKEREGDTSIGLEPPSESAAPSASASVREVFDHWAQRRAKAMGASPSKYRLDSKRRAKIQARLRDGYTVERLKSAIDGMMADPHHVESGFRWADVELACREGTTVERFEAMVPKPAREVAPGRPLIELPPRVDGDDKPMTGEEAEAAHAKLAATIDRLVASQAAR